MVPKSLLERIATLEATIEGIMYRLDQIVDYELSVLFMVMSALGAVAWIAIKKK